MYNEMMNGMMSWGMGGVHLVFIAVVGGVVYFAVRMGVKHGLGRK